MKLLNKVCYLFAIGFGIGNLRCLPTGTIAALLAIPIWWFLVCFFSYQVYLIFLMIGAMIGVYFCEQATKLIGVHDHKSIVWDELVGMWITLTIVPVPIYSGFLVMIAFLLFRIFDIIKPWPISWCDQSIKGGFGIMLDDIVASIISIFIMLCFMKLFVAHINIHK